jgi:hypothetical protein
MEFSGVFRGGGELPKRVAAAGGLAWTITDNELQFSQPYGLLFRLCGQGRVGASNTGASRLLLLQKLPDGFTDERRNRRTRFLRDNLELF